MSRTLGRIATFAASAALVATALSPAGPAQATPASRSTDAGVAYLQGQLVNGLLTNSGFEDQGMTIDMALALVATNSAPATVTQIRDAVAGSIDSYLLWGTSAPAKAAVLAQSSGGDATNFGGKDLIKLVEDAVMDSAPVAGRLEDLSTYNGTTTDYASTIKQAFAARALTVAGSAEAGNAMEFLLKQQCPEGYFRQKFTDSKVATAQKCTSGMADSAPHLDSTTLTVLQLQALKSSSPAVQDAITNAVSWLKNQQNTTDGSFGAGTTEGVNTNTTGLAGWVLADAGQTAPAAQAAAWVRSRQISDLAPCQSALSAYNGAIAPDDTSISDARTAAANNNDALLKSFNDRSKRATVQALPVMLKLPAAAQADVTVEQVAPLDAKSPLNLTVKGLAAGETACVSAEGAASKLVTGTGSLVAVKFESLLGANKNVVTVSVLGQQPATLTTQPVTFPSAPVATTGPGTVSSSTPKPTATTSASSSASATPTPTVTPTTGPAVGFATLVSHKLVAKKAKVRIRLTCPSIYAGGCKGVAVLATKKGAKLSKQRSISLAAGRKGAITLPLTRKAWHGAQHGVVKAWVNQSRAGAKTLKTKVSVRAR